MELLTMLAIGIIGAGVHLLLSKKTRSLARILEIILLWALIVNGLQGILAFAGHVFNGPAIAKTIGWPPGNPFQYEVGITNLGVGILGLMCIWKRDSFWLATIIMMSVFNFGAGIGHVIQIIQFQNYAPNNAGLILYFDLINPLVLIGLYATHAVASGEDRNIEPKKVKEAA